MKNLKTFALAAISLLGFAACQQVEISPDVKPEATHTVTFVAGAPETKTTVDISDNVNAKFEWTADDEGRFVVYENGVAASTTTGLLGDDGKMTIKATFSDPKPEFPQYQALFNTKVGNSQSAYDTNYDQTSDILVSNILSKATDSETGSYVFRFKRESAIAKMTLKGLTAGVFVSSITIESDKAIAGEYDLKTGTFINTSNTISIEALTAVTSEQAVVWFATIPVEDATFTVTATTVDNEGSVVGTYTKTFAKTISLSRGNVNVFGVEMTELKDPHKADNGWFLVKDARFLAAGDVIRIGCASKSAVAGSLSSDYLSGENAVYDGDLMKSVSASEDFVLGGEPGAWTLTSSTGILLGATSVKKLTEDNTKDNFVGIWSISITSDGEATIAPVAKDYGRFLCNAGSGNRFTTYSSATNTSMLIPGIYKKYGTPAESKKEQTISFDPTSYEATIGVENKYPVLTAQSSGDKSWTSSNTKVATIDAATGEITLVAAGETTISVTVAGDDTYNEGTGSYLLTVVTAPIVSTATWTLVKDAADLAVGDVIVIVAKGAAVALSTTQNSNNRGQEAITKNADNTVTVNENVQELTLGEGTKTGTFSLATGSGYLYAASSSSNNLKTQTTPDANGSWTISIANNVATIKAQGSNTRNLLKYNSSSSVFSCYSSGQGDVQIYRKDSRESQVISYSAETGSIDKYTLVKELPTLDVSGVKTSVSYTSSNETVATVSKTGEITPLKSGTTTITATAVASDFYREAIASFVLTVTDSTPYLNVSADNTTISANGGEVLITVDTNADSWSATSSDNDNFALGTPSENTVKVTVAKNTGEERTGKITITAGTLSKEITLTQKAASNSTKVEKTATISFGTNLVKIDKQSVTGSDDCKNSWTITTEGTTSFTPAQTYCQIGSKSSAATSITFTTTLPSDAEVSSIEGKFGGFSGTAGTISLKVGNTEIGTGALDATKDVTVTSTKTAEGNVVTVSITGIAKGVKCYYIKVGYKTAE